MPVASLRFSEPIDFSSLCASVNRRYAVEPADGSVELILVRGAKAVMAVPYRSLQGVSVEMTAVGADVTVRAMSSRYDFRLFRDLVMTLMEEPGASGHIDYEVEFGDAGQSLAFDWEGWIKRTLRQDFDFLKEHVFSTGQGRVYQGLFFPYVIGPRLIARFPRLIHIDNKLTRSQWAYRDRQHAPTVRLRNHDAAMESTLATLLDLDNPDGIKGEILVRSECLAVKYLRREFFKAVPFRNALKVVDLFHPLDEEQSVVNRRVSGSQISRILSLAERYASPDIFREPVMPGRGQADRQRTFVVFWNPEASGPRMPDYRSWLQNLPLRTLSYAVGSERPSVGDRWLMVTYGYDGPKGVTASGIFDSNPYSGDNDAGTLVCDLWANVALYPGHTPLLPTSDLRAALPSVNWRTPSVTMVELSAADAAVIEELWAPFVSRQDMRPPDPLRFRILR